MTDDLQPAASSAQPSSLQIALAGCVLTVAWMLAAYDGMAHWFLGPVLLCGVLIGQDAVEYLRGRLDMFDPVGIIGLFGVHFFFLAPLLHVAWDSYLEPYIDQPTEWRVWLGWMALINAAGLCLYQGARRRAVLWGGDSPPRTMRRMDRRRMLAGCVLGLVISGVLQAWFYASHGGVMTYIDTITANVGVAEEDQADRGMGIVFMVSESFPILAILLFAVLAERRKYARGLAIVLIALTAFFVLKIFFGGLRGSRSNIVWGLFWAAGIIHVWVRPMSRQLVATGLCFMVAFMYLYGFYKGLGREAFAAYEDGSLTQKSKRSMDTMLLGDLGRADVHAFLLHRILREDSDYQLGWGRTYIGALGLLIPRQFYPHRMPIKTMEGTDAFFGAGTYDAGKWYSSKVYGIAGETMLNFGPWLVPFAYLLFGLVIGRLQRFLRRIDRSDARLLIYPFLVNWCFSILQSDSDNLIFNFIKDGMMPMTVVWCGSRRVLRAGASSEERTPDHATSPSEALPA